MVELHLLLLMYLHNCIYIMARLLEVRLPTDSCGKIRKFTYVQMQILAIFCVRLRKSYVTPVGSLSVVFAR